MSSNIATSPLGVHFKSLKSIFKLPSEKYNKTVHVWESNFTFPWRRAAKSASTTAAEGRRPRDNNGCWSCTLDMVVLVCFARASDSNWDSYTVSNLVEEASETVQRAAVDSYTIMTLNIMYVNHLSPPYFLSRPSKPGRDPATIEWRQSTGLRLTVKNLQP